MLAVTSETSPLAKSEDYLTAIFMDDYIGGRYSSVSAVGGAILSLAFGPEVFAQLLDGAAAEDQLATNREPYEEPGYAGRSDRYLREKRSGISCHSCSSILTGIKPFPCTSSAV